MPDFELENLHNGPVVGLDEVGRGPLAGPVVAACVYIPYEAYSLPFIAQLNDSKAIPKSKHRGLYDAITAHCQYGVGIVAIEEIDRINILQASLKAMELACEASKCYPNFALVDGNKLPTNLPCAAQAIKKGDSKSCSIAAASIVAKVTRDEMMKSLHEEFPHYGWDSNAGYGSKLHLDAIKQYGITPHHRKSFAPIKNFIAHGSTRNAQKSAA